MNAEVFTAEIDRLKNHFGPAEFSIEKQKLIWAEVRDLSNEDFRRIVEILIGEKKPDWAIKLSEIRELANQRRKVRRTMDEKAASKNWREQAKGREWPDGLKHTLNDLGVKSLLEAITKKVPDEKKEKA